jgi:phosphoglycolate phosphatase
MERSQSHTISASRHPAATEAGAIRAILFDKDGTLVDFERTWGPAVDAVLRRLSAGDRAAYARLAAASRFDAAAQRFSPDSPLIGEPTSVYGRLWAQALGRSPDADFFAEIDGLLCTATTRHLAPIGNPRVVLGSLARRGYRLGLMTNDAEITAHAHVRKLGIADLLAFVAGYDSGFGAKPAPGPVLAFAHAVGMPAAQVAVVGDTVLDLAAAHAAGAFAIGVLTGPAPAASLASLADALIAAVAELPTWLDGRDRASPRSIP